jgi:transposase
MSMMAADAKGRRLRRTFTDEFKAGAVRVVLEEGKTVGQVSPAAFERRAAGGQAV